MKKLKYFAVFIITFLVYHIGFGSNAFPVDEATNTLMAPDWYPIVGIFLSAGISYLTYYIPKRIDKNDPLGERHHKTDEQLEKYYPKAIEIYKMRGFCYASTLQRDLNISFANGKALVDRMFKDGILLPSEAPCLSKDVDPLAVVDAMEGHQFEYWCAELLKKNGFTGVEVTPGSGDQGVDIIAVKDGIRYAVQCKCYSSDLGNTPVQEVNTGRQLYHCQIGVVMTNRYFTSGAKAAAEATGTLLWDRDKLANMIKEAGQ